MRTYRSNVEGLLMYSPAVFLHKGQILQVEQDTVETVLALQQGKITLVESENAEPAPIPAPLQQEQQQEEEQEQETKPETKKGKRRII